MAYALSRLTLAPDEGFCAGLHGGGVGMFSAVTPGMATPRTSLVVATLVFGCMDAFEPPAGTYPFEPPPAFQPAWESVAECSRLRGDLRRVQWYAVPEVWTFPCADGQECAGLWRSPHSIYVTEFARDGRADDYFVVRHEMLHDLLGGGEDHPPVFEQCGLMRR